MRTDELVDVDILVDVDFVTEDFVAVVVFDGRGGGGGDGGGECFLATLKTAGSLGPDRFVGLEPLSDFTGVAFDLAAALSEGSALDWGRLFDVVERDDACLVCLAGFEGLLGAPVSTTGPAGPFFGVLVPFVILVGGRTSKLMSSSISSTTSWTVSATRARASGVPPFGIASNSFLALA